MIIRRSRGCQLDNRIWINRCLFVNFPISTCLALDLTLFSFSPYSALPGILELLVKAFKDFTYADMDYKEDLKRRDMMDLPNYWHRDDAITLWDAVFNYVKEMIGIFYNSDKDVVEDQELQGWVEDVHKNGFSKVSCSS